MEVWETTRITSSERGRREVVMMMVMVMMIMVMMMVIMMEKILPLVTSFFSTFDRLSNTLMECKSKFFTDLMLEEL
eukprot:756198-Hanusia_phi.AAC.3